MKHVLDEWIIREVIDTLYMTRTTLLGITGLDSPQEVAKKSANETAITRRISKAIDIIQQSEQPEVDLEKEMKFFLQNAIKMNKGPWRGEYHVGEIVIRAIAHRFYELGLNARKSIWHNVSEETPTKYGEEVIVACRNKNKEDGIWLYDLLQCWEGKWEPRVNWETPVKWAYVKDLDNARKER